MNSSSAGPDSERQVSKNSRYKCVTSTRGGSTNKVQVNENEVPVSKNKVQVNENKVRVNKK